MTLREPPSYTGGMKHFEYLSSAERSIGTLYLSRYEWPEHPDGRVYEVYIDGDLLMSSVSPLSERELATRALAAHKTQGPLRILVGGLGLGYTAQAALESEHAAEVRVIDRMDFVIEWLEQGLLPLSEQLTTDPRVGFVLSDVYADLLGPASEKWDLILIDVDHSPALPLDPASLPFYTLEGQQRVREHLAPGGILAVWSAHPNAAFTEVMRKTYARSWDERVEWVVPAQLNEEEQHLDNVLFFGTDAI